MYIYYFVDAQRQENKRWTQRDPIDYQDSENLYQFCGNNPVNAWDPYGLWNWKGVLKGTGKI